MRNVQSWMPLAVGLALLVALGAFGFVLMGSARSTAEEALRDTAVSREQTLATLAEQYHNLAAKEAFDFGASHEFELVPDSETDRETLQTLLDRQGGFFSHGAALTTLRGEPLSTVASEPGLPAVDDPGYGPLRAGLVKGGPGLSSVMSVDDVPLVAVGVPILDAGTPVAVLVAYSRADTSHLQAYSEQLGRSGGGAPMVLDSTGTVAAAHDASLVGEPGPESPALSSDAPPTGFAEFERDGTRLVVAHALEPTSGWILLREQPAGDFFAPVANQSQTSQLALLGALVAGAVVAVVLNHRTHLARRRGEQRSKALVEDASDVITIVDPDGLLTYVSPTIRRVLGFDPDSLVGTPSAELVHPDDLERLRVAATAADELDSRERVQARVRRADGGYSSCELVLSNQQDNPAIQGTIISMRDVSELAELHEQLSYQATHDSLTELPNRLELERHLADRVGVGRDGTRQVAVLFADLDGFKPINDSLGHDRGDQLLVHVAGRLQEAIRDQDIVARLGGDEFVIVIDSTDARRTATQVADRVLEVMDEPFVVDGTPIHLGVSIGIALGSPDVEPGALLREADQAMYRAKERGRLRYEFSESTLAASPSVTPG